MVRGAAYDPDIVRRSIQQSNNSTNMGPTTFFDTIEHIKKEYQQLQQQVHKLRSDAEKKAQEVNMLQKQNQEASMQNQNFQLEAARQAEIARRMQQIIQQYMMHLPQEQQQSLMRGLESATKVTTQDIMAIQQQQQQLLHAMSGQLPPQFMAMMGMDLKPQDVMAQIAAMQNAAFSPAMQMQAQAAMAQVAQMNQLFSNPAAAAQAAQMMAAALPASSMAQMAAMQQHAQPKQPLTSTPISSSAQLPTTPMSSATIGQGAASPLQRAASSRSGSTAGTPLPKKFKMEEPQSRPISTSAKSDKSDEGGLVIDVQNEDQQQQNNYLNSSSMLPSTNGINGTLAAV
ncbi:unnamed protein product [Bursaphelenchus xylophilus]|nr:unnamed protein product [Bursaphelenchus xylophilus]CAG9114386.1 unnamed protein product [Bursaphelenchus xylophilus]